MNKNEKCWPAVEHPRSKVFRVKIIPEKIGRLFLQNDYDFEKKGNTQRSNSRKGCRKEVFKLQYLYYTYLMLFSETETCLFCTCLLPYLGGWGGAVVLENSNLNWVGVIHWASGILTLFMTERTQFPLPYLWYPADYYIPAVKYTQGSFLFYSSRKNRFPEL